MPPLPTVGWCQAGWSGCQALPSPPEIICSSRESALSAPSWVLWVPSGAKRSKPSACQALYADGSGSGIVVSASSGFYCCCLPLKGPPSKGSSEAAGSWVKLGSRCGKGYAESPYGACHFVRDGVVSCGAWLPAARSGGCMQLPQRGGCPACGGQGSPAHLLALSIAERMINGSACGTPGVPAERLSSRPESILACTRGQIRALSI